MIIHDLRSPLAGIYGFLELIREKATHTLSPDLLHYIGDALGSAKQMARIIDDVLDTSKMEEGKLKLKLTDCDLRHAGKSGRRTQASFSGPRDPGYAPRNYSQSHGGLRDALPGNPEPGG